jgi:membrane protease YdiL (CAAX protease family)
MATHLRDGKHPRSSGRTPDPGAHPVKPPPSSATHNLPAAAAVCLLSIAAIAAGLFLLHNGWAAILGYHAVLLAGLAWRSSLPPQLRTAFQGRLGTTALFLVLLSAAFAFGFYRFLAEFDPHGTHVARGMARAGLSLATVAPLGLYTCAVNPVLEELYWRGTWPAPRGWPMDVLYAAIHIPIVCYFAKAAPPAAALYVTGLVFAGALWRWGARRTGGLAAPVIAHALGDLAVLGVIVAMVTR